MLLLTILAQTADPTATSTTTGRGSSSIAGLLPFLLIGVLFFVMMRKQGKQRREHMDMLSRVQVGDEIETVAGMFGRVKRTDDDVMWVELAPGLEVKMSRAAIRRRVTQPTATEGDGA